MPRRSLDLEGSIELTLCEAYSGATKSVSLQLDDVCPGCRRLYRSESDACCGDRKSAEVVFEWLCAFSSMAMRVQPERYYTITSGIPLLLPSATTCIRTLDELLAKQCCQTTFTLQADRVRCAVRGIRHREDPQKVLFHDEYRRLRSCLLPAIYCHRHAAALRANVRLAYETADDVVDVLPIRDVCRWLYGTPKPSQ